jgi:hypothetical protein
VVEDRIKCNPNLGLHPSFTAEDAIVLTLLALRRGLDNRFLAILFGFRHQLVGDTVVRWICYLAAFLDRLCPDVTNEQVVRLQVADRQPPYWKSRGLSDVGCKLYC